jgi:hypothetical protein
MPGLAEAGVSVERHRSPSNDTCLDGEAEQRLYELAWLG